MDSKLRCYYEIPLNMNKTIVESGICVSGEISTGVAGYSSGGVKCKKVILVAFSTVAKKNSSMEILKKQISHISFFSNTLN